MIDIKRKEDCCGCNACGDSCPQDAIYFQSDSEGFLYPHIYEEKCTNCGICDRVCPIINISNLKINNKDYPDCYAAENKNMRVLFDSTSGGLFSALADIIYKENGYVGGAIFNQDLSVSQYISNDKNDLSKLRSSKYLQSDARGFYIDVKKYVKSGQKVLVCGTPCQMAVLRTFLGKDYQNLIIVDFVCLGVNSLKVWKKYLESFETRYGSPVVYAKAKSKEYGWRKLTQKVVLADGRHIYEDRNISLFMKGFINSHLYCRPSCYQCRFKGFPRIADISLADFWGIEHYNCSLEKNLGTSMVLVNSKKGESFFENIKQSINFFSTPIEVAIKGNPALTNPLKLYDKNRKSFFNDIDTLTFNEAISNNSNASYTYKTNLFKKNY